MCRAMCSCVTSEQKNYSKRRSFKESKSRMHSQKSPHSTPSDKSAFVVNLLGRTAALLWTHPECSLYVRLIFTVVCLRSCGKQFHLPLLLLPMDQQQQRYKQNTWKQTHRKGSQSFCCGFGNRNTPLSHREKRSALNATWVTFSHDSTNAFGIFFPFSSFALATTITNQVLASKPFVLICFSFPVCSLFSAEALCCKSNLLRSSRMDFVRFAITENRSNSIFAVGILCYSYSLNGFFFLLLWV